VLWCEGKRDCDIHSQQPVAFAQGGFPQLYLLSKFSLQFSKINYGSDVTTKNSARSKKVGKKIQ
jgi:hypothetical protein